MLYLMQKEIKTYLLYLTLLIPLALYWLLSRDTLGVLPPLVQGLMITGLTVIPVIANEQYEDKHKGYDFMRILPIKTGEIIAAKFMTLCSVAAILVLFNCLFFSFFNNDASTLAVSRSFILLSALASTIIGAIVYIGIFLLGYTIFLKVTASLMIILGMIPPLILKYMRPELDQAITNALAFMENLSWLKAIGITLIIFIALSVLATLIKKNR